MNSHALQLSGKFELPEPLEFTNSYTLAVEGDIVSIKKETSDDGSFSYCYAFKPLRGSVLDKTGKTTRFEKKSSHSAKIRSRIRIDAQAEGKDPDEEYDRLMILLRHYWPEVRENLESLDKNI